MVWSGGSELEFRACVVLWSHLSRDTGVSCVCASSRVRVSGQYSSPLTFAQGALAEVSKYVVVSLEPCLQDVTEQSFFLIFR